MLYLINQYDFIGSSFLGSQVNIIKLPSEVWLSTNCLLDNLVELCNVLVHQCSSIVVQRLLQISSLDVLQQMEQSHAHLIQLIDRLPARPQNRQTHVSVLVNVWMQNLVETLNLGRLERVFFGGLEGKGDLRVSVEWSILIGDDLDLEISDWLFNREGNSDVLDTILIVFLDVDLHSLFNCLEVSAVLVFYFLFLLHSLILEIFEHGYLIIIKKRHLLQIYKT